MKALLSLLACLGLVACSSAPQSPTSVTLRSDVLYFRDTDAGRRAAREVIERFEGKQEVVIISEQLPPLRPPAPIFQALPEYPPDLKAAGIGGEVVVDFIVDESGSVLYAAVLSTTHPGLSAAALNAVRASRFKPAQRAGVNVRSRLRVPLWFNP